MASISQWNPYGVALDLTATASTVTRKSATQYTVKINVSWATHWDTDTNFGLSATSGGASITLNPFGTYAEKGSGTITGTYSISGNTSATKTITVTFKNYNDAESKSTSLTLSVAVPAWTSYAVSYNANGGSGAPSRQTKWKDQTLTLSSVKPTRTGYSFQGWATSASGSVAYAPGASYTANAAVTLYAVWKANTYTVKYDANGGTGAPASQTKTYGVTLKLSSTIPTRTYYNFLGWGTSASATTVAYAAGGSYTNNAAITLYAIWELAYVKPRINNLSITRCDVDGVSSDTGTYALINFDWACDREIQSIVVGWESASAGSGSTSIDTSTAAVSAIFGDGQLSTEATYTITLTVTDTFGYSTVIATLSGTKFVIDFLAGGQGIALGKPAELPGVFDVAFQTRLLGGLLHPVLEPETDLNDVRTPNTYVGANVSTYNYGHCPLTTGTFTLEVVGMGEEGQVKQKLTYCHKTAARAWERIYYGEAWGEWVCVSDFDGQLLWSGGYYMTADHVVTLSEPVSKQRSGIVLVWSAFTDGAAANSNFHFTQVPKMFVAKHSGTVFGTGIMTTTNFKYIGQKHVTITDTTITGHANNSLTGTENGITFNSKYWVLRYVIGV